MEDKGGEVGRCIISKDIIFVKLYPAKIAANSQVRFFVVGMPKFNLFKILKKPLYSKKNLLNHTKLSFFRPSFKPLSSKL